MTNPDNDQPDMLLPPGITKSMVAHAVQHSGYPLQARVSSFFRENLPPDTRAQVLDEWTYRDRDSGDERALDLFVEAHLKTTDARTVARPVLNILVECKQSELPYVFFGSKSPSWVSHFPFPMGLRNEEVEVITNDDLSSWMIPLWPCLGLEDHPYRASPPVTCSTFSKCVRRGKQLELSGSEAYLGIVLPLLKAVSYLEQVTTPTASRMYFDVRAVVPLVVIDAPMVLVETDSGKQDLSPCPWVRLLRHEIISERGLPLGERWYALDIVSYDFLPEYYSNHLLPFAQMFGQRVEQMAEPLHQECGRTLGMTSMDDCGPDQEFGS